MKKVFLALCLFLPFVCEARTCKKCKEYCCSHEFYMKMYEDRFKKYFTVNGVEEIYLHDLEGDYEQRLFFSGCVHGLRVASERMKGDPN